MTDSDDTNYEFFYPNKMGRVILIAMQELAVESQPKSFTSCPSFFRNGSSRRFGS